MNNGFKKGQPSPMGMLGKKHTNETKEKMSLTKKGKMPKNLAELHKRPKTEEWKRYMSQLALSGKIGFQKGHKTWNKGKKSPRKNPFCIICKKAKIHPSTGTSYCKPCANEYRRKYYYSDIERSRKSARESMQRVRKRVIEHYGGTPPKCSCCGENHYEFLSLDHIKNDGKEHRKKVGTGMRVFYWVIRNKFPKGFQILCFNCNLAKGFSGRCPHKK